MRSLPSPASGQSGTEDGMNEQDRRRLLWLMRWSLSQLTMMKRRRKRSPMEARFTAEESATLTALLDLARAAGTNSPKRSVPHHLELTAVRRHRLDLHRSAV